MNSGSTTQALEALRSISLIRTNLNHNLDSSEDHRDRGRTSSSFLFAHTLDKSETNQDLLKLARVKRPLSRRT